MMHTVFRSEKRKRSKFRRAAMSLLLALTFAVSAVPAAEADSTYYIYIEADNTTLRSGPGYGYDSVGKVAKAGKINYLGSGLDASNNVWFKVGSSTGKAGWVSSDEAKRFFKSSAKPAGFISPVYNSDGSSYNDIYKQIYKVAADYGAVGAQVSVIQGKDGKTFDWNYGWSQYGTKRMGVTTKIGAGEIAETVTAICALKLQENKMAKLSESIAKYWGIETAKTISVASLLTNTSGLKSFSGLSGIKATREVLRSSDSFVSGVKPGTVSAWRNNPSGFGVAAATLELVVNETLEKFAEDNLFKPLDADMSFFSGGIVNTKKLANRYGHGVEVCMLSDEAKAIKPSGVIGQDQLNYANGFTSSTQDIAKIFYMLANDGVYNGQHILTTASVKAIEDKHFTVKENGAEFRQCLGLRYMASMYGTKGLYYSMGSSNGMTTFASYDPVTKNTVAVTVSGAKEGYDKYGNYKACGEIASEVYGILNDSVRSLYTDITKKGKALKPGDTIGIVAPSYYMEEADFNRAVNFLKKMGYNVKIAPSCTMRYKYYAGSDKQRAKDINNFFADDKVDGILCMRGGNGASRILDYLDYELIAKHPKLFIGYSDITALHIALYQKCGITTVHGAMLTSFTATVNQYTSDQFFDGIRKTTPIGEIKLPEGRKLEAMVTGTAEGPLVGGNLSVIASLAGTKYELKGDKCILLIEELGESSSVIDRMLQQLYQNGLFDRVSGIIIGDLTDCPAYEGVTAKAVIREFAEKIGKPVVSGVPCGHSGINMFMPLGVRVRITAGKDGSASVRVLESALIK